MKPSFRGAFVATLGVLMMVVYWRVAAPVLTPRIVGRALKIPDSPVLIGALLGGTLAALPGAPVAYQMTASIQPIMIKVVIPAAAKR